MKMRLEDKLMSDEQHVQRNCSIQAPDWSLAPMMRNVCVEKLAVRTACHMNCVIKVFGPRLFIGFSMRRCKKEIKRLIRTHVCHGYNGKKIGPLPSSSLQDPISSVIHTRRLRRNIGVDFTHEPMNEELKIRLTCSHFTMQHNSSRITMESLMLDANNIVDDPSNTMISSRIPSVQDVVFYDRNDDMHVKVIAMRDENNFVVKECDTLSESVIGSDIIF